MRKIREVLRLHYDAGLGIRAISRSLRASPSTVREYLIRAKVQGLSWPLPESLDDARLLRRLYPMPGPSASRFPPPDWSQVHRPLPFTCFQTMRSVASCLSRRMSMCSRISLMVAS